MMQESLLSISEFVTLMERSPALRQSFEKCIKDMRRLSRFEYSYLVKESEKDTRTTKIFLIYTATECVFSARLLCGDRCEINMVYTNPLYRGQGYCSNSLRKMVAMVVDKDVFLHVKKSNGAAIHCYEKAGFVKTKEMGVFWEMVIRKPRKSRTQKIRKTRKIHKMKG